LLTVNYFCRSATTIFAGRHQADSRFDSRSYDIFNQLSGEVDLEMIGLEFSACRSPGVGAKRNHDSKWKFRINSGVTTRL
jgi:hypothetical protein